MNRNTKNRAADLCYENRAENFKNKLGLVLQRYFMLVTLITVLLIVLGLAFDSDRTFGYLAYLSPLIYAGIGVIPLFFPGPKREMSAKALFFRHLIEVAVVETIILVLAFSADSIPTENIGVVIGIAGGIIVIYLLVILFDYLFEKKEADKMNEILAVYHETAEESRE